MSHCHHAGSPPFVDSSYIVSAISSLNSKIKNLPNIILAALSGTTGDNLDTDSDIGDQDDNSFSALGTMIAALSSKHHDFWKRQG